MFYFTCSESKIYESFTFLNKNYFTRKNELFHDILIYLDAPVYGGNFMLYVQQQYSLHAHSSMFVDALAVTSLYTIYTFLYLCTFVWFLHIKLYQVRPVSNYSIISSS